MSGRCHPSSPLTIPRMSRHRRHGWPGMDDDHRHFGLTQWSGKADHTRMTDGSAPDYHLAATLALTDPMQYRALFEPTRSQIVSLLLDRAATTSELAEILGKPKGTIGFHLKALEAAGLVRVVRTRRVRALEAKYYGRTARVFLFEQIGGAVGALS